MDGQDNPQRKRGRPFAKGESGNPLGRPQGARNQTTLALEALLDGEAEKITRKVIELALAGDTTTLRLCLDRLLPPRRERPVQFNLPPLQSAADAPGAVAAIAAATAAGEITPGEAAEFTKLVDTFVRAIEVYETARRLRSAENKLDPGFPKVERIVIRTIDATD